MSARSGRSSADGGRATRGPSGVCARRSCRGWRGPGLSGRHRGLDGVEEADELLVAVAGHVAADDGAVEHVQRGEERGGAVPLVVVGHRAGAALLHRQPGLGAVERLDLALLVDREHDGVRRRVEIEPDHVAQLRDEPRIVRELELPNPVRLEAMGAPDALDRTDADAGGLRHHGGGPVGRLRRRIGQRQRNHALRHLGTERRDARRPGLVAQQTVHALGHEPLLPAPDAGLGLARPPHDLGGPEAVRGRQDDPGTPHVLLRAVPIRDDRFQTGTVPNAYLDGDTFAHPPRLAQGRRRGNPSSGSIH